MQYIGIRLTEDNQWVGELTRDTQNVLREALANHPVMQEWGRATHNVYKVMIEEFGLDPSSAAAAIGGGIARSVYLQGKIDGNDNNERD